MSLEVGESEKCYRFLDGGVHCWSGPIVAFRDGPLSTQNRHTQEVATNPLRSLPPWPCLQLFLGFPR
jgi:hypothetical protein